MTLNVTVLTPTAIYQSADFRLSDGASGRLVSDHSPKTVQITEETWGGFATYTGLGRWAGRDVSTHIAEWLTGSSGRSMAEVAELIAVKSTELMKGVAVKHRGVLIPHTVTLAGFEGGVARVFVISNREDGFGRMRAAVDDHLSVSCRHLRKSGGALVIVTGQPAAVADRERRAIRHLAATHPNNGERIRVRLEQLNERAAEQKPDLISKACAVMSLKADGTGMLALNRAAENPASFPMVNHGMDMAKMLRDALRTIGVDLATAHIVGTASATTRHDGPTGVAEKPCNLVVIEPDRDTGYVLTELEGESIEVLAPSAQNDHGTIVGAGRLGPDEPHSISWIWEEDELRSLELEGYAMAVNNAGEIAGTAEGEVAVVQVEGEWHELPEYHGDASVFTATGSSVRAMNESGLIVGQVRSHSEEKGRPNTRPARFRRDAETLAGMDVPSGYGSEAIDINDDGLVLVSADLAVFDSRAILWNPNAGSWSYVGNRETWIMPISVLEDGTVFAQWPAAPDKRLAVVAPLGGSWERLDIDEGWKPVAINEDRAVVGYTRVEGFERPWLRSAAGTTVWLPYPQYHHTRPVAINNKGQIIGVASADHGSHAIVWRRH